MIRAEVILNYLTIKSFFYKFSIHITLKAKNTAHHLHVIVDLLSFLLSSLVFFGVATDDLIEIGDDAHNLNEMLPDGFQVMIRL